VADAALVIGVKPASSQVSGMSSELRVLNRLTAFAMGLPIGLALASALRQEQTRISRPIRSRGGTTWTLGTACR